MADPPPTGPQTTPFDWSDYETSRSGTRRGTLDQFYGEQVCCILDAEADTLAPHYDPALGATGTWPGVAGVFAPSLDSYSLRPHPTRAGCKELKLIYREGSAIKRLRPGFAVLSVNISGKSSEMMREVAGKKRVIKGPADDKPLQEWRIVQGSNLVLQPQAQLEVITVAETLDLGSVYDKIGKTNSNTLANFGNAKKHTLMLVGFKACGTFVNRLYWQLHYFFIWNPGATEDGGGWRQALKVKKFKKRPVRVQVVDENGVAVGNGDGGNQSTIIGWMQVDNDKPESRDVSWGSASFADLNGMLAWYQ